MFNPLDPLLTWHWNHPDFNASDDRNETVALAARQRAITQMLRGVATVDETLDLIADQGFADGYAESAIESIDEVINRDLAAQADPDEVVLYLPTRYVEQYREHQAKAPPVHGSGLILPPNYRH